MNVIIRLESQEDGSFKSDPFPQTGTWTFVGVFQFGGEWRAKFTDETVEEGGGR